MMEHNLNKEKYDYNKFLMALNKQTDSIVEETNNERQRNRDVNKLLELIATNTRINRYLLDLATDDVLNKIEDELQMIIDTDKSVGVISECLAIEEVKSMLLKKKTSIIPDTILLF